MSNKEVADIGEMLKFWDLRDEIFDDLLILLRIKNTSKALRDSYQQTAILMRKTESLGKKAKP